MDLGVLQTHTCKSLFTQGLPPTPSPPPRVHILTAKPISPFVQRILLSSLCDLLRRRGNHKHESNKALVPFCIFR